MNTYNRYPSIVGFLTEKYQEESILLETLAFGADFEKIIEEKGVKVNIPFKPDGYLLVFEAAKIRNTDLVRYLINQKGANTVVFTGIFVSLLHMAIKYNLLDIIPELVVKHHIDPNSTAGNYALTPLELAVKHGRAKAIKILQDLGADINQKVGKYEDESLLHRAFLSDQKVKTSNVIETIKALVDCGIPVDVADGTGVTPLMCVADYSSYRSYSRSLHTINALINLGANVHKTDAGGENFLQHFISETSDLILAIILMKDLDINYVLKSGILEDQKTLDRMFEKLREVDLRTLAIVLQTREKFEYVAKQDFIEHEGNTSTQISYSHKVTSILLCFCEKVKDILVDKIQFVEDLICSTRFDYHYISDIEEQTFDSSETVTWIDYIENCVKNLAHTNMQSNINPEIGALINYHSMDNKPFPEQLRELGNLGFIVEKVDV